MGKGGVIVARMPESTPTHLVLDGAKLRTTRLRLGIGQAEMAARLNVSQTAVSNWETALRAPRYGHIIVIAVAAELGVEPTEIGTRVPVTARDSIAERRTHKLRTRAPKTEAKTTAKPRKTTARKTAAKRTTKTKTAARKAPAQKAKRAAA
jgi:transcriptional regulator with XRE-family HTH domain